MDESLPAVRAGRLNLLDNLGNVLLESGAPREALQAYVRAIRLAPADPRGHYGCGLAWLRLDRPEKAAPCFAEALRLAPGFSRARLNLAGARSAAQAQAGHARSRASDSRTRR